MKKQLLYRDLAEYYDKIYHWKDYTEETKKIKELIKKHKSSKGNRLLEVGCGTGHHIQHLKDVFQCTGLDINKGILEIARKKHPETEFIQADMVSMSLERKYDVITCLFSSIGYVKTIPNLKKTLESFLDHLCDGGVVIIEPWFTKDVYRVGMPSLTVYEDDELKIARVCVTEIDGEVSVMNMHYLIAEREKKVRHFVDKHELGLFEIKDTLNLMKSVGFKALYLPDGLMKNRGLYIGTRTIDR